MYSVVARMPNGVDVFRGTIFEDLLTVLRERGQCWAWKDWLDGLEASQVDGRPTLGPRLTVKTRLTKGTCRYGHRTAEVP